MNSAQGGFLTMYASVVSFAAHGAPTSLSNGSSIFSAYFYNNRLQPCRISVRKTGSAPADCASSTTGDVLDFRYSFDSDAGAGVVTMFLESWPWERVRIG